MLLLCGQTVIVRVGARQAGGFKEKFTDVFVIVAVHKPGNDFHIIFALLIAHGGGSGMFLAVIDEVADSFPFKHDFELLNGEVGGKVVARKFVLPCKVRRNAHGDGVCARIDRALARQRAALFGGHFIDERAFRQLSDLRAVRKHGSGLLRRAVISERGVVPTLYRQFARALFHGQRGGEFTVCGERIVRALNIVYGISYGVCAGCERVRAFRRPHFFLRFAVRHDEGERAAQREGFVRLSAEGDKVALIESARVRPGAFTEVHAEFSLFARRDDHACGIYGGSHRARALCHGVILVDLVVRRQRYVEGILARVHHRAVALHGNDKHGLLIARSSKACRKGMTGDGYRLARVSRRREGQTFQFQLLLRHGERLFYRAGEVAVLCLRLGGVIAARGGGGVAAHREQRGHVHAVCRNGDRRSLLFSVISERPHGHLRTAQIKGVDGDGYIFSGLYIVGCNRAAGNVDTCLIIARVEICLAAQNGFGGRGSPRPSITGAVAFHKAGDHAALQRLDHR